MSDNFVLPKFGWDNVKMSDKLLLIGGPTGNKSHSVGELLQKKMKFGVSEGLIAVDTPKLRHGYVNSLHEANPDHKVEIHSKLNKVSLQRFIDEARTEDIKPKRFVVVDSIFLKDKTVEDLINIIFDEKLSILFVMVANSVYDVPESFRHKFDYVLVDQYPAKRLDHLSSLVKDSASHKLKMKDVVGQYMGDGYVVINNQEKVNDLGKEGKIMKKAF
jgi:hypothetical protein